MSAPIDPNVKPPMPAPVMDARGLPAGYVFKPEWEVTPRDLAARLGGSADERPLVIDVRRDEEWAFNRIEGAAHVPMDQVVARAEEIEESAGGKAGEVVVYCHHGVRSMRVATTLRAMGFGNVRSMAGGIDAWSLGVDAKVPRY